MRMDIQDVMLALNYAFETYGLSLPPIIRIDAGMITLDDGTFLMIDDLLRDKVRDEEEPMEQWY